MIWRTNARPWRFNAFLFFLCMMVVDETDGFGIIHPQRSIRPTALHDSNKNTQVEETLEDVDARVLRSMLQEQKLDLDTEDDIRKLLERGTVKRTIPKEEQAASKPSEYSSQAFQKLSETKLFQKLKRNAADFLESAGIAILNKIEQDVKVVAALGVFAWDRAVLDVARALPETASSPSKRKTLLLSANMTRPQDEIRVVRESVSAIFQGNAPGRSLRTAAPTGRSNAKVRQTRAFRNKKKMNQPNIPKIPGKVIDTAYELKRELSVETSTPGYRTAPARAAIRAATKGLLDQARTAVALRSAERKQLPTVDYKFASTVDEATVEPVVPQEVTKQKKERSNAEAYTYSYQDLQDYSDTKENDSQFAFFADTVDREKVQEFKSDILNKATLDVEIPTDVEFERSADVLPTYEVDFSNVVVDDEDNLMSKSVEIISDEDFDSTFAEAKSVTAVDGEGEDEEDGPPNPLTQLALRSFDIVFFLLEKVFLVAVPSTIDTAKRVAERLDNVKRKGQGKEGWKPIHSLASTKGRY